jgi:hypothetical protein
LQPLHQAMLKRMISSMFAPARRHDIRQADDEANPLVEYFFSNSGPLIHKWHHYLDIYHRHFSGFRGASPVVVEIGVSQGGSLRMWRDYFGPGCRIVGIDVDPRCRQFADDGIEILIGSQDDREFLASVREQLPRIDILIDDGGHTMGQQIATFEELYRHIQPLGIFLCEDMHTSMWKQYGGGVGRSGTFLEYSKALIDGLYAWYSMEAEKLAVTEFTKTTYALHFYDSILVIEKRPIEPPVHSEVGKRSFV